MKTSRISGAPLAVFTGFPSRMTTHPPMNQFAWLAPLPSDQRPVTR